MRQFATLAGGAAAQGQGFFGQYGEINLVSGTNPLMEGLFGENSHTLEVPSMFLAAPHTGGGAFRKSSANVNNANAKIDSTTTNTNKNGNSGVQNEISSSGVRDKTTSSGGYKIRQHDALKNEDEYYTSVVTIHDDTPKQRDLSLRKKKLEEAEAKLQREKDEISLRQEEKNLEAREKAVREQMARIASLKKT